jgi:hypothetical protein
MFISINFASNKESAQKRKIEKRANNPENILHTPGKC